MTTKDIQGTNITMLVSRDTSGYSEGKMFLDQGETRSELINKEYEYYNFKLSGKSLQKYILNTVPTVSAGFGLTSMVILNAADLEATSFACFYDMSGASNQMSFAYDADKFTLTLKQDSGDIPFFDVQRILYGGPDDIDLCQ